MCGSRSRTGATIPIASPAPFAATPLQLPLWLHVMINAYWEALDFDLPPIPAASLTGWWRWIDTARESPEDIIDPPAAPLVRETQYRVAPRSVAVLFARTGDAPAPEKSLSAKNVTTHIDVSANQPGTNDRISPNERSRATCP